MPDPGVRGSRAWLLAALLGVALVAAPAVFQMFTRAPEGGAMLDDFRPYMSEERVADFEGYLATIGASHDEVREVAARPDAPAPLTRFDDEWPTIDADMGQMLAIMGDNVDNFAAVDALPPFPLFPWFFVVPGLLVAGLGVAAWHDHTRRWAGVGVVVVGVGLLAAPAMFQMFTRAPEGGALIDDFRPYMTTEKVTEVQGYFLTMGAAEASLRREVLAEEPAGSLPATEEFVERWPAISADMAPMVGVMSDNVDNFAAVDALPPFPLFPWFFVAPGVLIAVLGVVGLRHPGASTAPAEATTDPSTVPAEEIT